MLDRRLLLAGLAVAPLAAAPGRAADLSCPPDAEAQRRAQDWPDLARFAADNRTILASGQPVDVVYMGDSITQGWPDKRPAFFRPGRVCRGIGGQTTPQMLLRMMADVVALKPRLVHIMGGTNDIAGNTGPIAPQQTVDNIAAMAALARAHGIGVLIGSVPPAASFPWRPGLEVEHKIATLNNLLGALADGDEVRMVDYTVALSDGEGGMKASYAYDGVHPDTAGYEAMEAVLEPLLAMPARR